MNDKKPRRKLKETLPIDIEKSVIRKTSTNDKGKPTGKKGKGFLPSLPKKKGPKSR